MSSSSGTDVATKVTRRRLEELASENPLAHPLLSSVRLHDYEYAPPPHLREIMGSVYRALDDDCPNAPNRLVRLEPRDHGKSETGSHQIPAWAAMRNPNIRILILMEAAEKAREKLEQCRNTIEKHGPAFGINLGDENENNKSNLTLPRTENHAEPTISARGFNSSITGGHYDLIIFDDIASWANQRTEQRREKIWTQFQDYTQNLTSGGDTVQLVLGTRKHPDDLYGRLIKSAKWDSEVKQAVSDWSLIENGEYTVTTDAGNQYRGDELAKIDGRNETIIDIDPDRDVDVLWPERWPLEDLIDKLLGSMSEEGEGMLVFKRENQNDAHAMQGQILSEDMLVFEPRDALPENGLRVVAGVDVAITEDPEEAAKGDSDYWAIAPVAHHSASNRSFVLDVKRRRGLSMKQALGWIQDTLDTVSDEFNLPVGRVLVESNQAQRWLVQEARDGNDLRFQQTTSSGSKEERIVSMASRFEAGRVRIIAPELHETKQGEAGRKEASRKWQSFANEWAAFPTGNHDDRLDAVEIALRGVSTENVETGDHDMSDLPL